jgi:DNA-binding NarL/FixJ family response regulator
MKNKIKLLIIDQSPLVPPRIKSLLSDLAEDILIGEARSFEEATDLLEYVTPDVVLIDLPVKDLITLLTKFKSSYPTVKVIVFSNHAGAYFLNTCMERGADFFIEKSTEFNLIPVILYEMISDELSKTA